MRLLPVTAIAFAIITILAPGFLHADPVPLLLYDFNKAESDQAPSSGSCDLPAVLKPSPLKPTPLLSKDGEGVTGKPGDFALDLRGATGMGKDGVGGSAQVKNPPFEGLKSFTLAGWIKCATLPDKARFFDYSGDQAHFLAGFAEGKIEFQLDSRGWNSTLLPPSPTGVWVFFAVTYDSTTAQDNLSFYEGVAGGDLAHETITVSDPVELVPNNGSILTIGNWPTGERTLQGLLDNMAVYASNADGSGALTPDQLRTVFTNANAAH